MQTRFELSNKHVDIKADDDFLYVDLGPGKNKLKIAFKDLQAVVRFIIQKIKDMKSAD